MKVEQTIRRVKLRMVLYVVGATSKASAVGRGRVRNSYSTERVYN